MQEQSRKRYNAPALEEKPKTMREVLDENFNFIDGELILKERYKKRKEKKDHARFDGSTNFRTFSVR